MVIYIKKQTHIKYLIYQTQLIYDYMRYYGWARESIISNLYDDRIIY